jgi:ABC-2 type transport system permease protein
MQAFFKVYPEWKDTQPITDGFHWKWYYAFQHLGDLAAAPQAKSYRAGLELRNDWTTRAAFILPAVGVQTLLHRWAQSDLRASLTYQDRIRAYHERLRRFYYPYLFNETPFMEADFTKAPKWE